MTAAYTPACLPCRSNDPTTFYRSCDGCQARKAVVDAQRRPPPPLTQGQVDGMDSTMQPLSGRNSL